MSVRIGVPRRLKAPHPSSVPMFVARAGTCAGLLDMAGGILPWLRHSRVHTLVEVVPGAAVGIGMLLLSLAHGLRRCKRRAWLAAVALLPLGAAAQFTYHRSLLGALIPLALLALLIRHRRQFKALPGPRSCRWALVNLTLTGGGSVAVGLWLVGAHPSLGADVPGLDERLRLVVFGLFGFEGPLGSAGTAPDATSNLVFLTLGALGLFTALTTMYVALRPEHPAARLVPEDEVRLRTLLEQHGARDSLGHFALRRDKGVVFSPSGKAAVCYRVVSGVMLASGDPIGDIEAWPGAIERFMDEATAHSWTPAVMGCSETGGQVWTREAGLDALELGDEAVVDVADFSLAGRPMRKVRQMVRRTERAGYTTRVRRVRDMSEQELDRIRQAADDWRDTDTERGFSMALGRVGDRADGDCLIATAHAPDAPSGPHGDLRAVLHYVPWGTDGASLDLMRRDRDAGPGLNELLIVSTLQAAPRHGIARVSLNFVMFRAALARGEKLGAGPVLRAWRGLLVFLSRWFQIESLYKFNGKFRPGWEPRFVIYRSVADLPRIGFAAMQAEGFLALTMPRPLRRLTRTRHPCLHPATTPQGSLRDADRQEMRTA